MNTKSMSWNVCVPVLTDKENSNSCSALNAIVLFSLNEKKNDKKWKLVIIMASTSNDKKISIFKY